MCKYCMCLVYPCRYSIYCITLPSIWITLLPNKGRGGRDGGGKGREGRKEGRGIIWWVHVGLYGKGSWNFVKEMGKRWWPAWVQVEVTWGWEGVWYVSNIFCWGGWIPSPILWSMDIVFCWLWEPEYFGVTWLVMQQWQWKVLLKVKNTWSAQNYFKSRKWSHCNFIFWWEHCFGPPILTPNP